MQNGVWRRNNAKMALVPDLRPLTIGFMTKQQAPAFHRDPDCASPDLPGPTHRKVPRGDTHERLVCPDCGFINYQNPKIVVGAVVTQGERILLCRRAIEPRRGYWTLPAGYMELNETTEEGAKREAFEEAGATLDIQNLLAIYTIPRISQVQILYHAHLVGEGFSAGEESLEVALFEWEALPWEDLAFPTVQWALNHYRQAIQGKAVPPFSNPPDCVE